MKIYGIISAVCEEAFLRSDTEKALHKVCGRAMIDWVLDAFGRAGVEETAVLLGGAAGQTEEHLAGRVRCARQETCPSDADIGTQGTLPFPAGEGSVLAVKGDMPLLRPETLQRVLRAHLTEGCAVTVACAREDGGEAQAELYCFDLDKLSRALSRLAAEQGRTGICFGEAAALLRRAGEAAQTVSVPAEELFRVHDRAGLARAEHVANGRLVAAALCGGATMIEPESVHLGVDVKIGRDTVLYPGVLLEGHTVIGRGCTVGPNTHLTDCTVGDGAKVAHSVAVSSTVGENTCVGPFAYLRPNSHVGRDVKIGDFVEIKNSAIGDGTKVSHLTYIGDADVGERVNFGCGTVVVNYDGKTKHRTTVQDDAFIGCNTNLVSPVTVGRGAYTAAGSTITDEVPEGALAIARSRQTVKEHWAQRRREKSETDK